MKISNITLDAVGKKCPMPVLLTKKELKKMNSGDKLEVIADDRGVLKDIPALLNKTGDKLINTKEDKNKIFLYIEKT